MTVGLARHVAVGPAVRGLHMVAGGTIQDDFAERYAAERGTMLDGRSGARCLCGFDDWPALYEIARDLLVRNAVAYVAILKFWGGDRYELSERVVDPDDPAQCTEGANGEVIVVRGGPPEARRHHQVVRALAGAVGTRVVLRLKRGETLQGMVAAFDAESEVGRIDERVFVAGQVLGVEA